jgi:hypothetical protein
MPLLVDDPGCEPFLVQVAFPPVAPIEVLRIQPVQAVAIFHTEKEEQ